MRLTFDQEHQVHVPGTPVPVVFRLRVFEPGPRTEEVPDALTLLVTDLGPQRNPHLSVINGIEYVANDLDEFMERPPNGFMLIVHCPAGSLTTVQEHLYWRVLFPQREARGYLSAPYWERCPARFVELYLGADPALP